MALGVRKVVPGRVVTNESGTGFKMNNKPLETMKEGDDVPGTYYPKADGGYTTQQPGGYGTPSGGIPTAGPGGSIPGAPGGPGGGGGAGGSMSPGGGGPNLTTYAQANPAMDQALADYRQRMTDLQAREGKVDPYLQQQIDELNQRKSADNTKRVIDQSNSNIRDFSAGQKSMADEQAARSGRAQGTGYSSIDEAAQRNAARAQSGIELAQQSRLDNLTLGGQSIMSAPSQQALQREGMLTGLYAGEMGVAGGPAALALQQQRLGLDQYNSQQQADLERQRIAQQQQMQYMQMMQEMLRNSGYGY